MSYHDSFTLNKGEYLCIVMEFCDGGDLSTRIKNAHGRHFEEEACMLRLCGRRASWARAAADCRGVWCILSACWSGSCSWHLLSTMSTATTSCTAI